MKHSRFQIVVAEVLDVGLYVVYARGSDDPRNPSCSTSFWLVPGVLS